MRWHGSSGTDGDRQLDSAALREPHGRASRLAVERLSDAIDPVDEAWLDAHLAGCDTCRATEAGYRADQARLRTLRDQAPQPPRDLWARTSIALEREAGRSLRVRRASHPDRTPGRPPRGWPAASLRRPSISLRVASGLLVVALAVTSLVVNGIRPPTPGGDHLLPSSPQATPITVAADIGWLQPAANGSYQVFITHVGQVCPESDASSCEPIRDTARGSITLGSLPESVSYSPTAGQLVVVSSDAATGSSVIVVPVPTPPAPAPSPASSAGSTDPTSSPSLAITPVPSGSPAPSGSVLVPTLPPSTAAASPETSPDAGATPAPAAGGAIAIAHDVIVVGGSAAYSPDGTWLAFAARPADGSAGPDVYVWNVGDPEARMVTRDHQSVFSAWLGNRLLGTRMELPEADPATSTSPGPEAAPDATARPGRVPASNPGDGGSPSPAGAPRGAPGSSPAAASGSPSPAATPGDGAAPADGTTGVAFLLDPATGRSVDLEALRYVHPVVDPTGEWVVYWEGTLDPVANGLEWRPGTGRIVVAPWTLGDGSALFPEDPDPAVAPESAPSSEPAPPVVVATSSPAPTASADPIPAATLEPDVDASPVPDPVTIQPLVAGPLDAFDARFDPSGTHLAIWTGHGSSAVGSLSLFVLADGRWVPGTDDGPAGRPALRGFSIGEGELAWVAPAGAGGSSRRVQVLGWTADGIGSVVSLPGESLIVIR